MAQCFHARRFPNVAQRSPASLPNGCFRRFPSNGCFPARQACTSFVMPASPRGVAEGLPSRRWRGLPRAAVERLPPFRLPGGKGLFPHALWAQCFHARGFPLACLVVLSQLGGKGLLLFFVSLAQRLHWKPVFLAECFHARGAPHAFKS